MRIRLAIIFFFIIIFHAQPVNSVQENKSEYLSVVKSLHFDIYYPEELSDLAVYTAKIAEESYIYLADYLQHELTRIVPLFIHHSRNSNYLDKLNKIDLSYTGSYYTFHKILTRRLVYIFQYEILYKSDPGWAIPAYSNQTDSVDIILDCMAYYLSEGFNETSDIIIKDIVLDKKEVKFFNIKSLKNPRMDISREIGRAFFFFLEKQYGNKIIAELLLNIRDFDSLYKAIEKSTGKSITEINYEWQLFYSKRYENEITGTGKKNRIVIPYKNGSLFPICSKYENYLLYLKVKNNRYSISGFNLLNNKGDNLYSQSAFNTTSAFEQNLFNLNNIVSFADDGKIVFSDIDPYSDKCVVSFYDSSSGKVIKKINLPFKYISDINISRDGKYLVFIGQANSSADIYIYDIPEKNIIRITDDFFTKRFPKISTTDNYLVFSSNENIEKNFEYDKFKLIAFELKTKRKSILVDNNAVNIHPDISRDNKKILYVSDISGIFNVYSYEVDTGKSTQLTEEQTGAFFPCWLTGGKNIAYSVYHDFKYRIYIKDITLTENIKEKKNKHEYKNIVYYNSFFDLKDLAFSDYSEERNIDIRLRAGGLVWSNGLAGNLRIEANDILYYHNIMLNSGFLKTDQYAESTKYNFDFNYEFRKYRSNFGLGAFLKTNPLQNCYYDNYEDELNFYPGNINVKNYGYYMYIIYPFHIIFIKNIAFKIKGSSNIYEDLYFFDKLYLKELSFSLNYDNIAFDKVWPLIGTRFDVKYTYDFTAGNRDFAFNTATFNFLQALNSDRLFVFTVKGTGGKIFGKGNDYFKYYLGGFNSIRGHGLFAYKGQNYFLVNMEARLIIIDKFTINWPALIKLNDISLGFFTDCGSAWNNDYKYRNPDTGEFEDFKAALGLGIRFLLQNHLVFKLDAAWPYYYKTFGKREILSGFELHY